MANRRQTESELSKARELIVDVSERLIALAQGDQDLLFAYRRKVWKELYYGERGKPMTRRALKAKKRREQDGIYQRRTLDVRGVPPANQRPIVGVSQWNSERVLGSAPAENRVGAPRWQRGANASFDGTACSILA